jgi:hypothetical protein
MSRDQWTRRAAVLFLVVGCSSGLSVGCADEPDDTGGGRGGRAGASGAGPDSSSAGGTTGSSGSSGFGGSAGSAGSGGAGAAGSGGTATGGTGGSGGSSGDAGTGATGGTDAGTDASTGGTSGTAGTNGTGGADAETDASAGGTSGSAGTSGTAGTNGVSGSAGADAGPDSSAGGTSGSAGTSGTGGADAGVDSSSGGTSGSGGTNGASGTGGVDAGPDGTAGTGGVDGGDCNGAPNTAPGFVNLAPPMGAPLDPGAGEALSPPPPTGWTWYRLQGAICRDGSPAGIFVRFTTSDKLFIYLEGGGACTNAGFCNFNPPNVNSAISGSGELVIGSIFGVVAARQQPGVFTNNVLSGIFDTGNSANPFRDWNGVYIPYCTGDVHSGTKTNGSVPGVTAQQQFVGHFNMRTFVSRIVPTFKPRVNRVVVTGASAGSFGAALNYSMIQDAFGCVKVDALLDSGVPFTDTYMPVCMQQRWRNAWGLNAALPPDCTECQQADGGGFIKYADFLIRKHPRATLASISSMQDEVIRLFFSMGLQNCANYDTADPVGITIGQFDPNVYFPAANYTAGMNEVRARYASSGRFATYFLGGPNINFHQHTFRARFFDPAAGTKTIAAFTTNFLNGTIEQVGP